MFHMLQHKPSQVATNYKIKMLLYTYELQKYIYLLQQIKRRLQIMAKEKTSVKKVNQVK